MKRALLLVLVLALAACPGILAPLEKPRVDLEGLRAAELSLAGLNLTFQLRVTNPNGVALPLSAMDYELSLEDRPFLRGRLELHEELPARAAAPVLAHVHITPAHAATLVTALGRGVKTVHVALVLHFETRLGPLSVSLESDTPLPTL
jgi:LEA14-like dessication related protein